jgi:hypothetical protein
VVYARVSSAPENTLADGAPIENTRLQVDCFDTTYAAAVALAESGQNRHQKQRHHPRLAP